MVLDDVDDDDNVQLGDYSRLAACRLPIRVSERTK